jgi:hypothetical protein
MTRGPPHTAGISVGVGVSVGVSVGVRVGVAVAVPVGVDVWGLMTLDAPQPNIAGRRSTMGISLLNLYRFLVIRVLTAIQPVRIGWFRITSTTDFGRDLFQPILIRLASTLSPALEVVRESLRKNGCSLISCVKSESRFRASLDFGGINVRFKITDQIDA